MRRRYIGGSFDYLGTHSTQKPLPLSLILSKGAYYVVSGHLRLREAKKM